MFPTFGGTRLVLAQGESLSLPTSQSRSCSFVRHDDVRGGIYKSFVQRTRVCVCGLGTACGPNGRGVRLRMERFQVRIPFFFSPIKRTSGYWKKK